MGLVIDIKTKIWSVDIGVSTSRWFIPTAE